MDDPPDEMFCPSCGERIRRSANFCRHCGEPNRKRDQFGWGPAPGRSDEETTGDSHHAGHSDGPGHHPAGSPDETDSHHAGPDDEPRDAWSKTHRGPPPESRGPPQPGQPEADDSVPWRAYLPPQARDADRPTWAVVGIAIGIGLLGMLLLVLFTVLIAGIGFAAGASLPVVLLGGTVVGQYIGFFGLSLWYLRYRGLDWERIKGYLGIRMPTLKEIALIFVAWIVLLIGAIAISILAELLAELLGTGEPDDADQEIVEVLADNPEFVPIAILIMFLVVGPCEEILFRGIVQGRLREHLSAAPAIGIASVFFAVLHVGGIGGSLEGILIALSVLTVSGVVLGALYEYTQNLVVVSLLHGFHNSVIVLIVYVNAVYDLEGAAVAALTAIPL